MDRDKAMGLFRLALNGIFTPFHMYGMDVHIPPAQEAIVRAALLMHERLNQCPADVIVPSRESKETDSDAVS